MEYRDLKTQYQCLKTEIDAAMQRVCTNANYISGAEVTELEQALAAYVGAKHCITCANGTDALSLVLMSWGIGKGDAVLVPDFTFFASGETVAFEDATPIFVDVDKDTFNLDAVKLEEKIIEVKAKGAYNLKAVISVDLFGLPANYPQIEAICKKYGLLLLEDGAQGFGGSLNGKMACSFGDAATTSFFPAKPLGCYGDGGAIFTNDDEQATLLRSIAVHGKGSFKYDNVRIGVNSRLDTLQAAILQVKLKAFAEYELDAVTQAAGWYDRRLAGAVKTPVVPAGYRSGWAQYTIQLESEAQRDAVQRTLKAQGIPTMVYYPKPMHRQQAFANTISAEANCPITQQLCKTVLSLPLHPYLSEETVDAVCNALRCAL
ncbi:MAG: DegT/DnrJ/EryC1/StrS family aminotransferase [Ruthenibacterium sp.]